jgi:hypothetical protein
MCYANPAESLAIARARLTPEQWAKFEADFEHHCDYSGLSDGSNSAKGIRDDVFAWAKWAYLCGKGL